MIDWKKNMEYSMNATAETEISIRFYRKTSEMEEFRERVLTKFLPGIEELLGQEDCYISCDIRPPSYYARASKQYTKEKSK